MPVETAADRARSNMILRQIRPWHVSDPRTLEVLEAVPREAFVPERYRRLAYADLELPLGDDEVMMAPRVEARVLQALLPQPGERALEIGTGSGYLTACLSRLCDHVTSIEIRNEFRLQALARLQACGLDRAVDLLEDDASQGWRDGRGYDVIAVTGSLPRLHHGFHGALNLSGRLFIIVGEAPIMEALCITRTAEHTWRTESLFDTTLPPLRTRPKPSRTT